MLERAHVEPLDSATYRLTWQVFRTPVTRRAMLVRARPTEARKPRLPSRILSGGELPQVAAPATAGPRKSHTQNG